ncbi:MAG: methylmalonyl-CoA mutase [Thermoplasmata archaeon]|mgnify:CR=1 FL=1|nr:MAG: methylmalonyl-CoA mutase [Thermoplasmata archaeon]RLF68612.1 MAG: methylmalonyl-CoA mutase [Thermoplasmata archaeon]RLF73212.1 MAG: methylmalonyl-CoA mutase [Thermoplasmata archaeon]RLF76622.1 MAG: methylmalonyl-CoA mutase [Thermoplasmata archaeon]HDD59969.1 methylmalonyl-CoA mutase [Euryarchaeota archaeon]
MYDRKELESIRERERRWNQERVKEWLKKRPERAESFRTLSGIEVKRLYTPLDIEDLDYSEDIGFPGEYPFTRGIHATMYRGRLWTFRQFSGFGTAEETNERFKYLLAHGETGLSVAFDYPTLYGYDTDHPMAKGEFGKCGVAVSSLEDMEILFKDIPVDKITTSMTINGPAAIIWAMYIAAAEKRGIPKESLGGTIQNDILKEYIAQKSYIFPPEPSMRLIVDTIEYGMKYVPKWNTISISGYHIREAGATAVQELAFTLADGFEYVKAAISRGLDIDKFAPRLSFFFNAHNNFFEEIAKFRAARRLWARGMKELGAKKERSLWMRFHTQTAGCSLTAQQPEINVIRVTLQALAAVLGGTQSLHTNSLDEALALPSEKAVRIALRTQQIIAYESGVTDTVDPLGGSYYVEWLTERMEEEAQRYFDRIEELGGVIPAIEKGFFQREIAESAYRYQQEVERGERVIVGVNRYVMDEEIDIPILRVDEEGERRQIERLRRLKERRDSSKVRESLSRLKRAAEGDENLMPYILDCVKSYATLGETTDVLREVFGVYKEPIIF